MDTQITNWEMSLQPESMTEVQEGIAIGPWEPYHLDKELLNWN